jgi:hypothetical protein
MGDNETQARIKGERQRVLENIATQTEAQGQQWWLSFADDQGLRGVVIAHGNEFLEALMQVNLHGCNPHGEVQGMPVPDFVVIPPEWTYRVLGRQEARELDRLLQSWYAIK